MVGEPEEPEIVSPHELSSFEVRMAILYGAVLTRKVPLMVMPTPGELVNFITVPPSNTVLPERVTFDET